MVKVTFSLDEATVAEIRRTATRLRTAQSQVIRDAVAEYAARADRMTERERLRMLSVLEALKGSPETRSVRSVDAELAAVRRDRRRGGRRTPA